MHHVTELRDEKKLLTILYSLWKAGKAYDLDHHIQKTAQVAADGMSNEPNQQNTAPELSSEAADGRRESQVTPQTPQKMKPEKSTT